MATNILRFVSRPFKKPIKMSSTGNFHNQLLVINHVPIRNRVTTDTGAFLPQPKKTPFGILRVMLTVLPGLYLGATVSKEGAAFLEENDIFIPDEDDDED